VSTEFLAFDLGAESGRAMRASLRAGVLTLSEVCRFPNGPVRDNGSLRWDLHRLWREMQSALAQVSDYRFESIGADAWGCDYGLLREDGSLLELPYTYRDPRTDGMMDRVFARVPRERIYAVTGIQFLWFNTLFQLYAAAQSAPQAFAAAHRFATIPDVLNLWLSGSLQAEYTNATTTQLINASTRTWATDLMDELGIPTRLLPNLVEPGTVIGSVRADANATLAGTPVVAPASHDTGSAFAAVSASGNTAFLSSGTWSLLGTELPAPIFTPRALELDFTNEGGVCGTTRLLKNIGGLWLLQSCRRGWAAAGRDYQYDELVTAAGDEPAFRVLLDPDAISFRNPDDMAQAIDGYCRQTCQPALTGPPSYARAIMESLAFKYRTVLESLEEITGRRFDQIRVVGGGARNRLLNQFTANATGRTVVAGPVEATALGNVAMQMLATGAVTSLAEARAIIDRSFPVERFEPTDADRWEPHYRRFRELVERINDMESTRIVSRPTFAGRSYGTAPVQIDTTNR
jgi:rhamnulokinase